MNNPLLITVHDIRHSVKVEELIKEKFSKLQAEKPDITKCHVFIERTSKHHKTSNSVTVRLDLKVPHIDDILVSEKATEDVSTLSTAVIRIFKRAQELFHERMKYIRDQKRVAATVSLAMQEDPEAVEV
jgi:hypothetical protein